MTQCVLIAIHITITTMASVGRIATRSTSRFGLNTLVIMAGGRNHLCLFLTACVANTELFATFGTSRCCSHLPCAKAMASCRSFAIHVAIATMASMGGITIRSTGRLCGYAIVIMSQCITFCSTAQRTCNRICTCCICPIMITITHPGNRTTIILPHAIRPAFLPNRIIRGSHHAKEGICSNARCIAFKAQFCQVLAQQESIFTNMLNRLREPYIRQTDTLSKCIVVNMTNAIR